MIKKISLSLAVLLIAFLILISFAALSDLILKSRVPVIMGGHYVSTDSWDDGFFSADGTWVNADGSLKKLDDIFNYALQKSKIQCSHSLKVCDESTAIVSGTSLMTELNQYAIERWDDKIIIFSNRQNCMSDIFTVSRDTKSVSAITRMNEGAKNLAICKEYGDSKDKKMQLADGFEVAMKLREDANPLWLMYLGLAVSLGFLGIFLRKIWWKSNKGGGLSNEKD